MSSFSSILTINSSIFTNNDSKLSTGNLSNFPPILSISFSLCSCISHDFSHLYSFLASTFCFLNFSFSIKIFSLSLTIANASASSHNNSVNSA